MASQLDKVHASVMATMVESGQAPHFTELAADLGVSPEEGLALINEVVGIIPGWMHPGTDYIASFPPFNNQPTQYRISVDGVQKWFGQ